MPLQGGIVLDLSRADRDQGDRPRPGARRGRDQARPTSTPPPSPTAARSCGSIPSTHKTGTLGGYIAGGSSGIGSITWGLLRDRGNILVARVVTMEAEPRILELRGADIQKVNHAYGTNGVITELEMPLAPAYRWAELLVALRRLR